MAPVDETTLARVICFTQCISCDVNLDKTLSDKSKNNRTMWDVTATQNLYKTDLCTCEVRMNTNLSLSIMTLSHTSP